MTSTTLRYNISEVLLTFCQYIYVHSLTKVFSITSPFRNHQSIFSNTPTCTARISLLQVPSPNAHTSLCWLFLLIATQASSDKMLLCTDLIFLLSSQEAVGRKGESSRGKNIANHNFANYKYGRK